MKDKIKQKKDIIISFAAIILVYVIFNITGIGCPIKFLTGISCAGCGMTRAWNSVLHLDFVSAFYYHPLFWLVPIALLWIIFKKKINSKIYKIGIGICISLFLIIYLARMINPDDSIVVFEPKNNILFKFYHWV